MEKAALLCIPHVSIGLENIYAPLLCRGRGGKTEAICNGFPQGPSIGLFIMAQRQQLATCQAWSENHQRDASGALGYNKQIEVGVQ